MVISEKYIYPRPDFIRRDWVSLSGEWSFDFDDSEELKYDSPLTKKIQVPFPYQSPASGIGTSEYHPVMWYGKTFEAAPKENRRTLLHFGAVDHEAEVWLNGRYLGSHSGGYTPFRFDVTDFIKAGTNALAVRVRDDRSLNQLRGKQIWKDEPSGCHYIPVSGIWQEVWLETAGSTYIEKVLYTPDLDSRSVRADITLSGEVKGRISLEVTKNGEPVSELRQSVNGKKAECTIHLSDVGFDDNRDVNWSPARPHLFDVSVTLDSGDGTDTVETYFGIRKISVDKNHVYLNNSQYYFRMILDQGYWEEGIYRPADDEGFRKDVELALALGFNGARKHQKIEDPKFYYWADVLGLMVWGELPSFYVLDGDSEREAEATMRDFIERDYNHPCITAWVPFNESWGLRKLLGDSRHVDFANGMYYLIRSADPTRLVSTNDGWENLGNTDISSVHDYRTYTGELKEYYSDTSFFDSGSARTGHPYLIPGEKYSGQPVMLTEFGGKRIAGSTGWGYEIPVEDAEAYIKSISDDMENILTTPTFCGYCYTQLTDVYQETNGLLYMNREPKADIERLKEIFGRNPLIF